MSAGKYRHRITVEDLTETNVGEATEQSWSTFASDVPAGVRPLNGKEVAAAGSSVSGNTRAFEIRYGNSVGMTTRMRISHEGLYFNILSITPDASLRDSVVIIGEAGLRDG
jgi:SPP1 family predicted phage head-tail adaptor